MAMTIHYSESFIPRYSDFLKKPLELYCHRKEP